MRISELEDNLNKLYCYRRDNRFRNFLNWTIPATLMGNNKRFEQNYKGSIKLIEEIKLKLAKRKDDNRNFFAKLDRIEMVMGHLKIIISILIIVVLFDLKTS